MNLILIQPAKIDVKKTYLNQTAIAAMHILYYTGHLVVLGLILLAEIPVNLLSLCQKHGM